MALKAEPARARGGGAAMAPAAHATGRLRALLTGHARLPVEALLRLAPERRAAGPAARFGAAPPAVRVGI